MKRIILDTDFCSDVDDAVAVRLLANLHKKGEIVFEAAILDSVIESSAAALGALLRLCGVENVPVGADRNEGAYDSASKYHKRLIAHGSPYRSNAEVEDGVRLYREILAAAEEKITVVGVGFENVIADLLRSKADDISERSGRELFAEKVDALYLMAGRWDVRGGTEFNIAHNAATAEAASYVAENCPVPIIYSGWEIGHSVIACAALPKDNPVREPIEDYRGRAYDGSNPGHCSYDPLTALLACIGDPEKAGYRAVYGKPLIDPKSGRNDFIRDGSAKDCFVVKRFPDLYYARMLDEAVR